MCLPCNKDIFFRAYSSKREHFIVTASCITHIWNKLSHKQQLQAWLQFNRIIRAELKCCYPPFRNGIIEHGLHHPEKGRQGLSWTALQMIHTGILTSSPLQGFLGIKLHPERRSQHLNTSAETLSLDRSPVPQPATSH